MINGPRWMVLLGLLIGAPAVAAAAFALAPAGSPWPLRLALGALATGVFFLWLRSLRAAPESTGLKRPLFFAALLAGACAPALVRWYFDPYGMWDGMAIWNARARAYAEAFSAGQPFVWSRPEWNHPGYPPALPLTLAAASLAGGWGEWLPIAFACALLVGTTGLIYSAFTVNAAALKAWPFALCAASLPGLSIIASDLGADYPLAFGLAAACRLALPFSDQPGGRWNAVLFGALCAWMIQLKNEGAMLALCAGALFVMMRWTRAELTSNLTAGTGVAAGFALLAAYKAVAPDPEAMPGEVADFLTRLLIPANYLQPAAALLQFHALHLFGLGALLVYHVFRNGRMTALAPIAAVHGAYMLIFVVTSYDQAWHIRTAFNRIQTTLWPAALIIAGYSFAHPQVSRAAWLTRFVRRSKEAHAPETLESAR